MKKTTFKNPKEEGQKESVNEEPGSFKRVNSHPIANIFYFFFNR